MPAHSNYFHTSEANMCPIKSKLLLATFLSFLIPASFAERADRDKPINLEADHVTVDDSQKTSTFTGNVRLSQGSLLILGDKIITAQDQEGFMQVTVFGNTASFRQKREGLDGYVEGYGKRIEYDTHIDTIQLHEQARLKRDLDEVIGEHITYSSKTEIFQVNGKAANTENTQPQRVRAVIQPRKKEDGTPLPPSEIVIPEK